MIVMEMRSWRCLTRGYISLGFQKGDSVAYVLPSQYVRRRRKVWVLALELMQICVHVAYRLWRSSKERSMTTREGCMRF